MLLSNAKLGQNQFNSKILPVIEFFLTALLSTNEKGYLIAA